jgi:hypothetical protein
VKALAGLRNNYDDGCTIKTGQTYWNVSFVNISRYIILGG